jgi:hypothetical protein
MMVEEAGEERRGGEEERCGHIDVGIGRPHVARLDGPAADAIVAALGAMVRGGAFPALSCGVSMPRAVTDLVRPAEEGAGEDETGQERDDGTSHRENAPRKRTDPILE